MLSRKAAHELGNTSWLVVTIVMAMLLSACSEVPLGGLVSENFDESKYAEADAYQGGLLYDNWWETKGITVPPTDVQALWAERDTRSTAGSEDGSSWRCVTCHGWDYKGSDGAFSIANNPQKFTGFPGLFQLKTKEDGTPMEAKDVFDFIQRGEAKNYNNALHQFGGSNKLSITDIYDLTAFVMQYGFEDIGGALTGTASQGSTPFSTTCAASSCHDNDLMKGKAIDVADENPEEFIHKARFGQPNSAMKGPLVERTQAKNILKFLRLSDPNSGNVGDFNQARYNLANLANGGLIYDKWWETTVQKTAPTEIHTLWPKDVNADIGASSSWRCSQCHGWDYRGKDGAFSDGSDFSGIKGIIATTSTPVLYNTAGEVYNYLKTNVPHGFGTILTEAELYDVTLFVMTMRDEAAAGKSAYQFISNKRVIAGKGNIDNGKKLYHGDSVSQQQPLCSTCHGEDGKQIDFADKLPGQGEDEFLSDVAVDNPWEYVHKTRFGDVDGDTGQRMPGLVDNLDETLKQTQAAIDILAYTQEAMTTNITRAGRLYDDWATEAEVTNAPTVTNPIWSNTNNTKQTGATTWRCKSCHGWDYLGSAGDYGDTASPYYTGIKGLMTRFRTTKAEVADFIKNGGAGYTDHAFGNYLNDADIDLLAEFITNNTDGIRTFEAELAAANSISGTLIYKAETPGNCEACHGTDGTLQASPIGDTARDNVAEFLHKVRFGQPGSQMTVEAGMGFEGLSPQQAADVYAYTKTLGQSGGNVGYASASIARGGRLFDKWWEELASRDSAAQPPAEVNPLWLIRNPSIPDIANTPDNPNKRVQDSWRCKSCHGWDYQGIGFNTGIQGQQSADNLLYKMELIKNDPGLGTPEVKQAYVYNWIKSGLSTDLHNFGTSRAALPSVLDDVEIWDLVKFLMEGIINTDTYIYETFKTVKGPYKNLENGKGLYSGSVDPAINCSTCHGADGLGVASKNTGGMDIFLLASEDPWEFLHKVRFGSPNAPMPAFLNPTTEHSTIHALNVLDYAQDQYNSRPGVAIQITP